jgi:hypothetical protein
VEEYEVGSVHGYVSQKAAEEAVERLRQKDSQVGSDETAYHVEYYPSVKRWVIIAQYEDL